MHSLYLLTLKCQASSHNFDAVQPGLCRTWSEHRRQVSWQHGSHVSAIILSSLSTHNVSFPFIYNSCKPLNKQFDTCSHACAIYCDFTVCQWCRFCSPSSEPYGSPGELIRHRNPLTAVHKIIRITCPCDLYPLAHHFYILKLEFIGVYTFSIFALKHRPWVLVRIASLRRF